MRCGACQDIDCEASRHCDKPARETAKDPGDGAATPTYHHGPITDGGFGE
jgi:hypothetical protein